MDKISKKIRSVATYCNLSLSASPEYTEAIAEFRKYLAEHDMTLIDGDADAGLAKLPADLIPESGGSASGMSTAALPHSLNTVPAMAGREAEIPGQADAVVMLPGSFGMPDGLAAVFALLCGLENHKMPVGILNVNGCFEPLLEVIEQCIRLGFVTPLTRNLLKIGSTPESLLRQLAGLEAPCNTAILPFLLHAMQSDDIPKVKTILNSGIDPNICSDDPDFPLLYYALGSIEMLKLLLGYGADVRRVGREIWSFLAKYEEKGMRFLVQQGLDVTWVEPDGTSPLTEACAGGFGVATLRLLIRHGAVLSRKTLNMALISASGSRKDTKVLQFLLTLGADLKDRWVGHRCMELAIDGRIPAHIEFLLDHGVSLHPKKVKKWCSSYLKQVAVDQYGYPMLKVLLAAGADVNYVDKKKEHVLFDAVRYGALRTVKALVNAGIDVDFRNRKGKLAIDFCDCSSSRGRSIRRYLRKVMAQK